MDYHPKRRDLRLDTSHEQSDCPQSTDLQFHHRPRSRPRFVRARRSSPSTLWSLTLSQSVTSKGLSHQRALSRQRNWHTGEPLSRTRAYRARSPSSRRRYRTDRLKRRTQHSRGSSQLSTTTGSRLQRQSRPGDKRPQQSRELRSMVPRRRWRWHSQSRLMPSPRSFPRWSNQRREVRSQYLWSLTRSAAVPRTQSLTQSTHSTYNGRAGPIRQSVHQKWSMYCPRRRRARRACLRVEGRP